MAVEQMMDFFENGNIRNSVNFPAVDMGPIEDKGRIALFVKAHAVERLLAAEEFSGIKNTQKRRRRQRHVRLCSAGNGGRPYFINIVLWSRHHQVQRHPSFAVKIRRYCEFLDNC